MKSIIYLFAFCILSSCTSIQNFGFQFSSSSYDRYVSSLYKASLDETSMGKDWITAGQEALESGDTISLPFKTTSYFAANRIDARSYRLSLQEGQKIYVQLRSTPRGLELFNDLFFYKQDREKYIKISPVNPKERRLEYLVKDTGTYIIRIQPRLLAGGRYELEME